MLEEAGAQLESDLPQSTDQFNNELERLIQIYVNR
jgi:hypothetical protein